MELTTDMVADTSAIEQTATITAAPGWTPQFRLDLITTTTRAFIEMVAEFAKWAKDQPVSDEVLADGWHTITPEIAEKLLVRNASNREPSLANVAFFAMQMGADDWPETGQPLIFRPDGTLADGQHRLWACYFSGVSFTTYVVNLRTDIANIFAYIDSGKSRTAKDALQTAGLNGLSSTIAQTVSMSMHFEAGAYKADAVHKLAKITNRAMIDYVEARPNLRQAVRLMAGEHKAATKMIGHKDVASFSAYQILELHDEFTLDEFMGDVGADNEEFEAGNPIAVLQVVLKNDRISAEPMRKHQVLAHVVKCFNAWREGEKVKKISLRVNEPFPQFVGKQADPQAEPEAEQAGDQPAAAE